MLSEKIIFMKFRSRKMHFFYSFGLLYLFLVTFSYSTPSPDYDVNEWRKWSDGDDDYYDDYSNEINNDTANYNLSINKSPNNNYNINNNNNNNSSSTLENITTIIQNIPNISTNLLNLSGISRESKFVEEEKCPINCNCYDDYQFINCTNRNLENIPKDLPSQTIRIDLSHNLINHLKDGDLQKLILLREINLKDNEISSIDKEVFFALRYMNTINLARNKLSFIDPDTFSEAIDLIKLDLNSNPLRLQNDNNSFLNQPGLKELNIQNTGIHEIYDQTFYNLSGLTSLTMDKNDFNKKINTKAFEKLKSLVKLKLPELEQNIITELCQLLTSIDNISFKNYAVSCYELSAGSSFNDSLILVTPNPDLQQLPSLKGAVTPVGTNKNLRRPGQKLNMKLDNNTDSLNPNETLIDPNIEKDVFLTSKVIDYMLIGIIVIAVIGLIIGVICRKDYCGIKTKLCRTKKTRRPPPTDQVRPTEEIPLNKV